MKTLRMLATMFVVAMLTAGFAGNTFADDIILDNKNTNTSNQNTTVNTNVANTATGGNAAATGGNVDFRNSYINPIQPVIPGTSPIQTGPELSLGVWGLFMPTFFETATLEQSVSLSAGYSRHSVFSRDRLGTESVMFTNLAPTSSITIVSYWGRMGNDQYVASFPIFGKRGDQLEGLIGMALQRAMELGANKVGIMLRVVKEVNTKGLSTSVGAGAGLYIPCNSGVGTGVSFGAYISNTKTEDMYELSVVCLKGGAYVPPKVAPPVEQPKPAPPQVCDPTEILVRIQVELNATNYCPDPCLNNLMHRKYLADEYVKLYHCTGDKKYLYEAIKQYGIAERDFLNGWEPKKTKSGGKTWTRNLKVAQELVYKARYNWAWCVYILDGYDAEMAHAQKKGLDSAPEKYEELKF